MLESTKQAIINAYQSKTGLSEAKLSHMMDAETWMNAKKAVELGFADEIFGRGDDAEDAHESESAAMEFSPVALNNSVRDHIAARFKLNTPEPESQTPDTRVPVSDLMGELDQIKKTWR
jgi:ATP-dependent Clp protease protease subunit